MLTAKRLAAAASFVVFCGDAGAAISVCGSISAGAVWSLADSPVSVTCDLNITELEIQPGVEVRMAGAYQIIVSGPLRSLGSRDSPVVFRPAAANLTGWRGFLFEDALDGSIFRWTHIEGATRSGVRLVRSHPQFEYVTFRNNSATRGGAIYAELLNHDLQIQHSRFIENHAETHGGAIYATGPTGLGGAALVVTDSVFLGNAVGSLTVSQDSWGGAIYIAGNSRILRSTFRENEARAYTIYAAGGRFTRGGALVASGGRSEIEASLFVGNACRMDGHYQTPDASRAHGGAVYLLSGELLLRNDLLAKNLLTTVRTPDPRGGGLFVAGGTASIVNATIVYNDRHAIDRSGGTVELLNSILFFNNTSGVQIAGSVAATYSDIQGGYSGLGNLALNPILDDQFRIVAPSPAIDAGEPSVAFNDILPPGVGTLRNDIGFTGGAAASPWNNSVCYRDADGDGYGDARNYALMGSCFFDYVADARDCDDANSAVFPGAGCIVTVTGACGLIAGVVWSLADSPVNVTCDLNVADLVIQPGVEVRLAGDYQIVVSGKLRSLGTRNSPVVFRPADTNSARWRGFSFEDALDGSIFRWTHIERATRSGVHLVRSYPSFEYVTFQNNSATQGGAIYAEVLNHDLQIQHSRFLDNRADTHGGAIYSSGPTALGAAALVVTDSEFLRNVVGSLTMTQNTWGGAIFVGGNSRISRSTFRENEARAYTIYAAGGRFTRGGALSVSGGRHEVETSMFERNGCRMDGDYYTPDASHSHGGAVYLVSGELLLRNSLLAKNILTTVRTPDLRGGGVFVASGTATIVNSTMAYNDRHAVDRSGGTVELLNSILFFNNNNGAQIAGSVAATYSDIQGAYAGLGNLSLNPILDDHYHIVSPSPAIDAGNPGAAFNDILPPGLGTLRNDMGYAGGPHAVFSPPFTDPVLTPGVSVVRSVHLMELRTRIDAVRASAGFTSFSWTDDPLIPGMTVIRAIHILQLRDALSEAYVALGKIAPTYTDPNLGVGILVRMTHIVELRQLVIAVE